VGYYSPEASKIAYYTLSWSYFERSRFIINVRSFYFEKISIKSAGDIETWLGAAAKQVGGALGQVRGLLM
jgi:hypothetical protein